MSSTHNPGRVAGFCYLLLIVIGPLRLIYIPGQLFAGWARVRHGQRRRNSPMALPFRHCGRPRLRRDECRMTGSPRELIVLSLNLGTYDATKQSWNIRWLNVLAGTCGDLVPEELARVRFNGQSIIYPSNSRWPPTLYARHLDEHFRKSASRGEVRNLTTGIRGGNSWWLRPMVATRSSPS